MAVLSKPVITGIDITAYLVQDVDRAKAFYRDTLGMTVTNDYGPNGGEFSFDDGTTFGIWKDEDTAFVPSSGVMFAVADLKSAVEYYSEHGVTFAGGGAIHDSPVCSMAMATDPEGNSFILHQRRPAN